MATLWKKNRLLIALSFILCFVTFIVAKPFNAISIDEVYPYWYMKVALWNNDGFLRVLRVCIEWGLFLFLIALVAIAKRRGVKHFLQAGSYLLYSSLIIRVAIIWLLKIENAYFIDLFTTNKSAWITVSIFGNNVPLIWLLLDICTLLIIMGAFIISVGILHTLIVSYADSLGGSMGLSLAAVVIAIGLKVFLDESYSHSQIGELSILYSMLGVLSLICVIYVVLNQRGLNNYTISKREKQSSPSILLSAKSVISIFTFLLTIPLGYSFILYCIFVSRSTYQGDLYGPSLLLAGLLFTFALPIIGFLIDKQKQTPSKRVFIASYIGVISVALSCISEQLLVAPILVGVIPMAYILCSLLSILAHNNYRNETPAFIVLVIYLTIVLSHVLWINLNSLALAFGNQRIVFLLISMLITILTYLLKLSDRYSHQ